MEWGSLFSFLKNVDGIVHTWVNQHQPSEQSNLIWISLPGRQTLISDAATDIELCQIKMEKRIYHISIIGLVKKKSCNSWKCGKEWKDNEVFNSTKDFADLNLVGIKIIK